MPGPLFSASRASRRLRWPPEPSPAASLGDVGSGCRPRLAPALPAAPRLPPVTSAPRTTTRPRSRERSTPILLGVALYRSTLRRRCLAGDPCLDAAARPSTARWLSASPRMRRDLSWRGKLQECFVLLAGEVQAILSGDCMALRHFASRDASKIMTCFIGSAVSCGTCCDKLAAINECGNVI